MAQCLGAPRVPLQDGSRWRLALFVGGVGLSAALCCRCSPPAEGHTVRLGPLASAKDLLFKVALSPASVEICPTEWRSPIRQRLDGVPAEAACRVGLFTSGLVMPLERAAALDCFSGCGVGLLRDLCGYRGLPRDGSLWVVTVRLLASIIGPLPPRVSLGWLPWRRRWSWAQLRWSTFLLADLVEGSSPRS